ncbi:MAG: chaperone modulator CbpM [bacterium]|nr:chaperone modulator CbpM [bacterium]
MEAENLLALPQFCQLYQIEYTFIDSLQAYGLIEIVTLNEEQYIHHDHLKQLEKIIRLHYDLEINMEGIDVIAHLLQRMDEIEGELRLLKNKHLS